MLLKLTGGRIIDPAHDVNDVVRDIYIRDGRIVEKPTDGRVDEENRCKWQSHYGRRY